MNEYHVDNLGDVYALVNKNHTIVVDYLYDAIQKDSSMETYQKNKEWFHAFYYRFTSIKYNGMKVLPIFQYLLEHQIEDEDMPLCKETIFKEMEFHIWNVTEMAYSNNNLSPNLYIDQIKMLEEHYHQVKKFDEKEEMMQEEVFQRQYSNSLILTLNRSFFQLSTDQIRYCFEKIQNNEYLEKLIQRQDKLSVMDREYLFQYISRFLFTNEFYHAGILENDALLEAFASGELHNKEAFQNIIQRIDADHFVQLFRHGFGEFLDLLEKNFSEEFEQRRLFQIAFNKIQEKEYFGYSLDFLVNDERAKSYLDEKQQSLIIQKIMLKYNAVLSDKEVLFLLDQNPSTLFLTNLKENLKSQRWSEDTIQRVQSSVQPVKDLDKTFEEALSIFDSLFKGESIKPGDLLFAMKALVQKNLEGENPKVYFTVDSKELGCYVDGTNSIKLNSARILDLAKCKEIDSHPEMLHPIETVFHESRHWVQFQQMRNDDMPEEFYEQYKENLLSNLNSGYYSKNYFGITFEQDARVYGALGVLTFLKTYFPYMENSIQYYEERLKKEQLNFEKEKQIFELSKKVSIDEALEKIIALNPKLLSEHKALLREYQPDGMKIDDRQL